MRSNLTAKVKVSSRDQATETNTHREHVPRNLSGDMKNIVPHCRNGEMATGGSLRAL